MITKLNNSDDYVARQIYTIFQASYKIEAALIGVVDFPPLKRSSEDIVNSRSDFYGYIEDHCIAAIIEVQEDENRLDICSLVVAPEFFRKGIAGKLLRFALVKFHCSEAIVETAVLNTPAIKLYQKYGFVEYKRWTPSHGIEKLAFSLKSEV